MFSSFILGDVSYDIPTPFALGSPFGDICNLDELVNRGRDEDCFYELCGFNVVLLVQGAGGWLH